MARSAKPNKWGAPLGAAVVGLLIWAAFVVTSGATNMSWAFIPYAAILCAAPLVLCLLFDWNPYSWRPGLLAAKRSHTWSPTVLVTKV